MARKPRPHIPQSGEELTAAWFTRVLADRVDGASVVEVTRQVIGSGIGFVGELHRCELTWDRDRDGLPGSVVVKVPSKVLQNRILGEGLFAYEREIRVYQDFDGCLGLPMPAYWYGEMDPDPAPWLSTVVTFLFEKLPIRAINWLIDRLLKFGEKSERRYVLVIEDIRDVRSPMQVEGGSVADVRIALELLARFHAANWMAEQVVEDNPHFWGVNRTPKVIQASYRRNRDGFLERFGSLMNPAMIAKIDALEERIPEAVDRLVEPPWSLLHGDYRLDNILFRPEGDPVVVDYQAIGYGRPGWDVAYFITTALSPEHRDEEDSLLRTYHDALIGAGATGHSFEQLRADVVLTKDLLAHRMIGAGDLIDTALEGRDDSFVDLAAARIMGWVDP